MAFTKIRQTVAAFERPRKPMFDYVRRDQHERQIRRLSVPGNVNLGVRLAVLLLVVFPVSYVVSALLHRVFHFNFETVGIITSAILSYSISTLHGQIVDRVHRAIPLEELNAFFGSTFEETAAALRRRRPKRDPKQPQLL